MSRFLAASWASSQLVVVALVAACGGEDGGEPGTITVAVNGVTGGQGKLLITEARIAGRQAAISCVPIAADPFTASVVLEEIVGPTPCEDSAPISLDAGTYDLLSVVMMGGGAPETCARGQAVVDGDVTVAMPAFTAAACN
jgi:hypothetical protein